MSERDYEDLMRRYRAWVAGDDDDDLAELVRGMAAELKRLADADRAGYERGRGDAEERATGVKLGWSGDYADIESAAAQRTMRAVMAALRDRSRRG